MTTGMLWWRGEAEEEGNERCLDSDKRVGGGSDKREEGEVEYSKSHTKRSKTSVFVRFHRIYDE